MPRSVRDYRELLLAGRWFQGLPAPFQDALLAAMVSSSRQTTNQVLKELEARGLLRLASGEIEILDLAGLRAVSAGGAL